MTVDLSPDYYLTNFQFLLNWVALRYEDLLLQEEREFILKFPQLSHQSQCLFVRLASRKGQLFRADKLSYSEIDSLDEAAKGLIDFDLIKINSLLSLDEASNLLIKTEILHLFKDELHAYKSERKVELVSHLAKNHSEPKTWQNWTNHQLGRVYELDTKKIISNFLLLFFGNSYQDLTEFVLQDLGLFRYETYTINHQYRIFKNREELEQHQQLALLREHLEAANTIEQIIAIAEHLPNSSATAAIARRRARLCNQLAYVFEQHNQYHIAMSLYKQSHLPPARERQIRLLEKQGDYTTAQKLLEELIATPDNEQELQIAERIAPRLAKKLGKSFTKKLPPSVTEQHLVLPLLKNEIGIPLNVEEIAKLYFHTPSSPCLYVENQLLAGLFGLWLWPEIFRSLDSAFANPFQSAPLDMYDENFRTNRPKISELWQLFENDSHREHIRNIWALKQGIANHFVNWQLLDENTLELALACIPARHLKLIFERILFDIKNNRSGLPDLIQFFPETCDYRMLEIKGPGDRLQDNQKRWLNFFGANEIRAEVVYVSWQ